MKVLVMTDWPALEGGTERAVETLIAALRASGDEVRLLTSSAGSKAGGTADYVAYGSSKLVLQTGLQIMNPGAVIGVRRALSDFRPDAVHLNMFLNHMSPAILMALRRVPTLAVVHDYKATCLNQTRIRPDGSFCESRAGAACASTGCVSHLRLAREAPRYGLLRRGLRHVDHIRTISTLLQTDLLRDGVVAGILRPPVDAPPLSYERRPTSSPTFAYGGRFAPVKGVDVLLRAFDRVHQRHPDARLDLYGDGPDRDALIALARDLGLHDDIARFHIGMPRGWAEELAGAWALVAPSTYREPFGIVAVEAIDRGVPVIATGPGTGFAETVEPGVSGVLVSPGSVDELAHVMLAVADAGEARTVPADVASAVRARHDPAAHADAIHAIFEGGAAAAEPLAEIGAG